MRCPGTFLGTLITALLITGCAGPGPLGGDQPTDLVRDPASLVDPMIGTTNIVNTFPGPDLPFGMIQWSPDTWPDRPQGGGYEYRDSRLRGFSLTHLSGPGCNAYGDVPILPLTGGLPAGDPSAHVEPFSHVGEFASPGAYTVSTGTPSVRTELTTTRRSGMARVTYPPGREADLLIKPMDSQNGSPAGSARIVGTNEVQGSTSSGHFCGANDVYTVYFDITFDHRFTSSRVIGQAGGPAPGTVFLTFASLANRPLQAKVAVSFVSAANARLNWQQDNPSWDFDSIRSAARGAWNSALGRIQVAGGTRAQRTTFYTALYHALLHPNLFSDVNGQYIGLDGRIHSVPAGHAQYANYSGWDTYHTQIQLSALVAPRETSDIVQSMVNDAAQNHGQLPKWALANGESYVMVGDPADGLIGGAYAFGARDFDTRGALRYAIREATRPSNIRPGLSLENQYGYLPDDAGYGCCNFYGTVSTLLEYGEADFALSRYAAALGDAQDASMLLRRANNWRNVLDPATGLLTARSRAGAFALTDLTSTGGYVEGDASQYRWIVPFNERGLIKAMGGSDKANAALDAFFTRLNDGWAGASSSPYAYWSNQFGYQTPWTYDYTGSPWRTQDVVNGIRTQLFQATPGGEPDNEDLGAGGATYVWAALGLFPGYIATADLLLNSPLFPKEVVNLPGGKTLTISAPGASATAHYVQSLSVNGKVYARPWLPASFIQDGATLDYTMSRDPRKWGSRPEDAPPSYPAP